MEATRTLVKSPPELWAELSDADALARHLGPFGAIRITRTEPESVVEWEGDRASGSVRLEPAGWGTRVTLTAEPVVPESSEAPPAATASPPAKAMEPPERAAAEPSPEPRRGFWARLFRRRPRAAVPPAPGGETALVAPEPPPPEPPPAAPEAEPEPDGAAVLDHALDALGAAHHRPFSR
jgi:hypothetical protein